jgi:hypothetical protein
MVRILAILLGLGLLTVGSIGIGDVFYHRIHHKKTEFTQTVEPKSDYAERTTVPTVRTEVKTRTPVAKTAVKPRHKHKATVTQPQPNTDWFRFQ